MTSGATASVSWYYGPIALITDALSYSATDIFAAGFQDNEVGVVLGTDGNTGAGGANYWSLDNLRQALKKDPKSPFKALPKGAEMIVAMRRSIRVGPRAGAPLEEFGVAPDVLHAMTRRDILQDNYDLFAAAAKIIRRQPYYTLSVQPVTRKGARGIVVSAATKRPSSRAGSAIAPRRCLREQSPCAFHRRSQWRGGVHSGHDRQGGQQAGARRGGCVG